MIVVLFVTGAATRGAANVTVAEAGAAGKPGLAKRAGNGPAAESSAMYEREGAAAYVGTYQSGIDASGSDDCGL